MTGFDRRRPAVSNRSVLLPPRRALPLPGDRISLGALQVSPFCVGMVLDWRAIPAAFEAGINFFFISGDMHWPLYDETRRGIADLLARGGDVRERIVVAVCAYVTQPIFCTMPFEEAVHAVPGLGRADVLVAGGAYGADLPGRLPVFLSHRRQRFLGAGAIGVSFHDRDLARVSIADGAIDLAFIRYNAAHPGAREDLFPHLPGGRGTRVYNFKSTFARVTEEQARAAGVPEGFWLPEVGDHYRFALSRPELDGILCSPGTPAEVTAMLEALDEGPMTAAEEDHLLLLATLIYRPDKA